MHFLTILSVKASDLEALADAVRSENHRIHALEAQKRCVFGVYEPLVRYVTELVRGQQPFVSLNDYPMSYFEQNKHGINWERVAQKVYIAK